jgi:cyclase
MKKKRVIPVLLLRNGFLVQSKEFKRYQNLGNPITAVKRLSEWASDELIYIDISNDTSHDMRRDDLGHPNRATIFEIIEDVSKAAFMPITVGGRIRTMEDIEQRLALGADKVCINTIALENPAFIEQAAKEFGSQCVVISIDVKMVEGRRVVMAGGKRPTDYTPEVWAREVEQRGAGEILLNSTDRDGMKTGYDLDMLNSVTDAIRIPLIACGGVGEWDHFTEALEKTNVDAVAAANIFTWSDQSVFMAKKHLHGQGMNVRPAELLKI